MLRGDAVDVEQRIEAEVPRLTRRHEARRLERLSIVEDEHVVEVHLGIALHRGRAHRGISRIGEHVVPRIGLRAVAATADAMPARHPGVRTLSGHDSDATHGVQHLRKPPAFDLREILTREKLAESELSMVFERRNSLARAHDDRVERDRPRQYEVPLERLTGCERQ